MIIYFQNNNGQPITGSYISVIESPVSMPDLGMITDEEGSISVDIPMTGEYVFQFYDNEILKNISINLNTQSESIILNSD